MYDFPNEKSSSIFGVGVPQIIAPRIYNRKNGFFDEGVAGVGVKRGRQVRKLLQSATQVIRRFWAFLPRGTRHVDRSFLIDLTPLSDRCRCPGTPFLYWV